MKINIFLVLLLGLVACSKMDDQNLSCGYVRLEGITYEVDGEIIPLTRAVDAGLHVQIWQNGALVEGKDYAPGADFSKRITLPVGKGYTIKAFTPDQAEAGNEEAGHPVFSVESAPFEVVEADITTISLTAPQINVGIAVSCEDSFTSEFTNILITITSESGRSVIIQGGEDSGIRYFNLPVSGELTYKIEAENADGEHMERTETLTVAAKNYTIQISI